MSEKQLFKIGVNNGQVFKYNDDPEKSYTVEDSLKLIADAGFDSVDFSVRYGLNEAKERGESIEVYFTHIKEYAHSLGLIINQTHARTAAFEETVTEKFFQEKIEDIKATHYLGAKYIVIHPLQPPWAVYDRDADYRKKINLEFFNKLRPYLDEYDVTECIENLFRKDPANENVLVAAACSRPEEILYYIDNLKSEHFKACLDLGHMLLTCKYTGDTVAGAIRKLGDKIKVIHAHDNKLIKDDHFPPFFGEMDWKGVMTALKEVGFNGVFNLELMAHRVIKFDKVTLPKLLKFSKDLADRVVEL